MTKRLAIVAHFDPRGAAAPHFLRQLDQLGDSFDEVVVATTSELTSDAVASIEHRAHLIQRPNVGHDFGSWRDVLESRDFAQRYDELLLTNDSYVGFVRPLPRIIETMATRPYEMWGMAISGRHSRHVQSYFLYFQNAALRSKTFYRFWSDMRPARSRLDAIMNQEIGISHTLADAGFRFGAYFEPTRDERMRANRRGIQWLRRRQREFPSRFDSFEDAYFKARAWRDPRNADFLNPSAAFADSILDDGRFPVLKFDTLRYDPYFLGSDELLTAAEDRFPEQFDGVRQFILDTTDFYKGRRDESSSPAPLSPLERATVGYRRRPPHREKKAST